MAGDVCKGVPCLEVCVRTCHDWKGVQGCAMTEDVYKDMLRLEMCARTFCHWECV